ncbi:MAG: hypothetical protein LQ352_007399, partial [Teloschistes flavicans]
LFLDLLSKHRRKSIASRDLSSAIVFAACPCVVENETRAERDVARNNAPWSPWDACIISVGILGERHEVIVPFDSDRVGLAMSRSSVIIYRCVRSAGRWRVVEMGELRGA